MQGKNKMFLSVISRFLMFLILLILIIFIQNIGVNLYAREYISRYVLAEKKGVLSVQMSQLDKELTALNDWIVQTISGNNDFLQLAYKGGSPDNDYRLVNSYVSLGNYFDSRLKQVVYEEGFFAYFPEKDLMLFRGYDETMSDYIKNICYNYFLEQKNGWNIVLSNGKAYILGMYQQKNSCCGAWVSLDFVIHQMDQEINKASRAGDGLAYALTDEAGTVLAYYERVAEHGELLCGNVNLESAAIKSLTLDSSQLTVGQTSYDQLYVPSDFFEICLVEFWEQKQMAMEMPGIYLFFLVFSLMTVGVGTIFILWMYKRMIKPLRKLKKAIVSVEKGNLAYRIASSAGNNEFEILNQEFNEMLEQVRHLKMDIYEMTIDKQRTKLRYLSQQIQPHFILNVLNILYSYEAKEHAQIQKMILYLSRYFRYIVNLHSDEVPLGAEFRHVENYLKIQKVRYPYQFNYSFTMDDQLEDAPILPLLIQTFVENSIKYAVCSGKVLDIYVRASALTDTTYQLIIYDTGRGYPAEVLKDIQKVLEGDASGENLGIGIINAVERLKITYGANVDIIIKNREESGTYVQFILPWSSAG